MTLRAKKSNYYDVLHVSRDAPVEIIRASYRTLMQRLKKHPDLGGDATTAALINAAYSELSNDKRRAEYDASLDAMQHDARHQVAQPSRTPERLLDVFSACIFCGAPHRHRKNIRDDAQCGVCASPLHPAKNRRVDSKDQRDIARISKRQIIHFYTHWPQSQSFTGHSEDVSLSGMRFQTNEKLGDGQLIKIVGDVIEAIGAVMHCSKIKSRDKNVGNFSRVVGVSFVTVRFVRSIGGFVSDHV